MKRAEPRDIKAADGTVLDFMPGGPLALFPPGQLTAGALPVNPVGLSAAAAAGSIPGIYPAGLAAQGWSPTQGMYPNTV